MVPHTCAGLWRSSVRHCGRFGVCGCDVRGRWHASQHTMHATCSREHTSAGSDCGCTAGPSSRRASPAKVCGICIDAMLMPRHLSWVSTAVSAAAGAGHVPRLLLLRGAAPAGCCARAHRVDVGGWCVGDVSPSDVLGQGRASSLLGCFGWAVFSAVFLIFNCRPLATCASLASR